MQLEQLELTGGGTLTLYLRESVEAMPHFRQRPLVLVVPGGGYTHVSPREGDPVALQFAAAGYHTAVLHYAVGESARDALPMRQLAQAIGLVRQHAERWNILPDQIALCGFSAGGHLALSGAVWEIPGMADQPRPNALLLAYPVVTAGEYALLQSGEFSWASLNFMKGKLVAEAAAAKPVPDIAAGTLHGLRARVSGTVVRTNLVSGTMLVVPGQAVEAGQGLIGTARAERDGTLIFQPAAGSVRAQFEWENEQDTALLLPIEQLTGQQAVHRTLFWDGHAVALPSLHPVPNSAEAAAIVRHYQPEALGLPVPVFIEETTYYYKVSTDLERTEEQALALARLQSKQALQQNWADFELLARKEDVSVEENVLHYRVVYTITADICK